MLVRLSVLIGFSYENILGTCVVKGRLNSIAGAIGERLATYNCLDRCQVCLTQTRRTPC